MADLTKVYRVVYNDGKNHNALVFKEPVEGLSYKAGQMIVFGDEGQSSFAAVNDEGDIPQREPSGEEGENLGITWHFAK
jgi:hypothetical protein